MKICFATGNTKKYEEVKKVFDKLGLELEWLKVPKPEPADEWDIAKVAIFAAKEIANEHKVTVVVEDTGFFFEAFNHFPGPHSKFVYRAIGYDGILKLLKGANRKARFLTVAAICEPGKEPITFDGVIDGSVAEEVHGEECEEMPYDRIFIPEGGDKPWILDEESKKKDSHRVRAFTKVAEFILNK